MKLSIRLQHQCTRLPPKTLKTRKEAAQESIFPVSLKSEIGTRHSTHPAEKSKKQILPAGILCACRTRAGCRCLPRELLWPGGTVKKLLSPPSLAPP